MGRATGFTLLAIVVMVGSGVAFAAPAGHLYLAADSEPVASMSPTVPPDAALTNFDPQRDSEPGLLLVRSDAGVAESDPTRYQQWEYDASGLQISVSGLVIWAGVKDFAPGKAGRFAAYLMDCASTCTLLDTGTAVVSQSPTWKKTVVPLNVANVTIGPGRRLVVKISVLPSSDEDMLFAYATAAYAARLQVNINPNTSSTTSTTSPAPSTTQSTTTGSPTTTSLSPPATNPAITTGTVPQPGPPPTSRAGDPPAATGADTTDDDHEQPAGIQDLPSGQGTASSGESDAKPAEITRQAVVLANGAGLAPDMFRNAEDLDPTEGLTVVFSTVAENIRLYWQVAVALGALGALLTWIGASRLEEMPTDNLRSLARLRSLALRGSRSDRPVSLER